MAQQPLGKTRDTDEPVVSGDELTGKKFCKKILAIPNLRQGQQHPDVAVIQKYLKHYGYLAKGADSSAGELDSPTSSALSKFQGFRGLPDSGDLDLATKEAIAELRCGFPDFLHSVDFSVAGPWSHRNLKYCFGTLCADVTATVARNAVRRALDTWTNAGVGLTFAEVAASQNPDIFIEWRPAADPDHSMVGGVVAHADFPPGFQVVGTGLPLPLHYDDSENVWVDGAVVNGLDIETIGLHELGHCLGLYHSADVNSIMYAFVSANHINRNLTADDMGAIRNLYPTWRSLGGIYIGKPAVVSWADNRTDVFVRGTDNAVHHKWWDGTNWFPSQSGWESLGGNVVGNVTAVSWGPGRIDLFVQGTDNAVHHKAFDNNTWSPSITGWESLGGLIIGDVSAVSWGPSRLDLFVRGMNNSVYHKAWDGTSWQPSHDGWLSLGGKILGEPKAISRGPNRLDIFVRGLGNGVHQKTWNGVSWLPSETGWQDLGGIIMDDPVPVSWGPNRIDLFVQGTGNGVHHKAWDGSWHPSQTDWEGIGGIVVSNPTATAWGGNRIEIFVQGTDNAVWQKSWNGSSWVDWRSLGGVITDSPVVNPRGSARPQIFVRGTNASLYDWS